MSLLLTLAMLLAVAPAAFADEVADLKKRLEKLEAEMAALKQLLIGGNSKTTPSTGGKNVTIIEGLAISNVKATRERSGMLKITFVATNEEKETKRCRWTRCEIIDQDGNTTNLSGERNALTGEFAKGQLRFDPLDHSFRRGVPTKVVVQVTGVSKDASSVTLTLEPATGGFDKSPTVTLKDIAID
jgi:hypothetical protein